MRITEMKQLSQLEKPLKFGVRSNTKIAVQKSWGELFFTMPDRFNRYATKHWVDDKLPLPKQKMGQFAKWFTSQWLQHDFTDVKGIPSVGFGRHLVMPPMGAVAIIVILSTLSARLYYALKRSQGNDNRELGDILRRDIPTLGLLVFAQEPLVQGMTQLLQDRHGIQLLAKQTDKSKGLWHSIFKNILEHELTYSELDRYYRITHQNRLMNILQNPNNHRGALQVLNDTALKSMSHQQQHYFRQFSQHVRNAIRLAKRPASIEKVVMKAYTALKEFENAGLRSTHNLNIRHIFSDYAKHARHGSVLFSLAIIVGLLGYGVTRFNEWWSIRQYKALLKEERQAYQNHRHT